MTIFLTALVSLIGIGFGALLQHVLSRSTEARKLAYAAKNQAYVDYLRAVAQAAHARTANEQAEATMLLADAKARIAVYGTAATIEAMAKLDEVGPALHDPKAQEAFLAVAAAMREDMDDVSPRALSVMLLGPAGEGLPGLPPTAPNRSVPSDADGG
jgi:hypothetical protein